MIIMILKMSAVTALYVLLTTLLWTRLRDKRPTTASRIAVGVIYGLCSVLSTHFAVNYGHMLLNVRDIGPLAAGLFFDPVSGVIAGLIGGIERYIAGYFWGIGAYTRVACSVSTCLAGFLAALLHLKLFKRKKPSVVYAFFMGAVMEVFHMYVALITHRDDMHMAYYVVTTCAGPMIVFTGLGLAGCSFMLQILAGEWRNPFRRKRDEEVPVSQKFQFWLFAVTTVILLANFGFSYAIQTQTAIQNARDTLTDVSGDIVDTYQKIQQTQDGIETLSETIAATDARAVAEAAGAGGPEAADEAFLERALETYGLEAVGLIAPAGSVLRSAGDAPLYVNLFTDVLNGDVEYRASQLSSRRVVGSARCGEGMVQVVLDTLGITTSLNKSGLDDSLSYFHVGNAGMFDIIARSGYSIAGAHKNIILPEWRGVRERCGQEPTFYQDVIFDAPSMCRVEKLEDGAVLLALLPMTEVYANRDAQALETAMADILLFTVIYVLISMLVQQIVVNNLDLVNSSLAKITGGDLNEVVNVRDSSEFASLSDDINQTVSVLKGYIEAAEKRIEQELEFARTIQDAALPKNFRFPREDFQLYATMDPAKEVGGDFYDFFFIDANRLALVIADVSGKGIPAALFMMRSKTAIRGLAESGIGPSEILYRANNTLCEGNDAEMFVTVWIGIVDLRTGVMQCANAGHEYPILMRASGDYELFKDKHGLALAAMENVRFRAYDLQLNPGDRLFVYTDGIPEAIDEQVAQYGADRLVQALNGLKDRPMSEVLPAVRQDIRDFVGGADQFDDITMLGFAYWGGGPEDEDDNREEERA